MKKINRHNISEYIKKAAVELRDRIWKGLFKKLFSLKIDLVTCRRKCYLGINVQLLVPKKNNMVEVKVYTLGSIEIKDRKSVKNLKETIISTLVKFELDIQQIFSNTTDNGKNVVACTRELNPPQPAKEKSLTSTPEEALSPPVMTISKLLELKLLR